MEDIEATTYVGDKRVHLKMPTKVQLRAMTKYLTEPVNSAVVDAMMKSKNIGHIVDVGANIGFVSLAFAEIFPFAKILSLEPSLSSYGYLEYNCKDFPNIMPDSRGAYRQQGYMELSMPINPSVVRNSGLMSIYGAGIESESIYVERLDDIVTEPVDFLKIDVEGAEIDVLEGAPRILAEDRPILMIEFRATNLERAGHTGKDLARYILEGLEYVQIGKLWHDPVFVHRSL